MAKTKAKDTETEDTGRDFTYAPDDGSQSPAHNLFIGEVQPGETYHVPAEHVHRFDGHPDWRAADDENEE